MEHSIFLNHDLESKYLLTFILLALHLLHFISLKLYSKLCLKFPILRRVQRYLIIRLNNILQISWSSNLIMISRLIICSFQKFLGLLDQLFHFNTINAIPFKFLAKAALHLTIIV